MQVLNNTVTGRGHLDTIAQNGVVILSGASALIKGNSISGNWYTPGRAGPPAACSSSTPRVSSSRRTHPSTTRRTSATSAAAAATPTPDSPVRQPLHREARSGGPCCAMARRLTARCPDQRHFGHGHWLGSRRRRRAGSGERRRPELRPRRNGSRPVAQPRRPSGLLGDVRGRHFTSVVAAAQAASP